MIGAHSPVIAAADSLGGATVNYTLPTATDNVDPVVTVTCAPAPSSYFTIAGSPHTVTCNATDTAGNHATQTSFTVTVTPDSVSASQSTIGFDNPGQISTNGGTATFTITAKDQYGNLISGASVTLTADGTNNTFVPPNPSTTGTNGQVQIGLQSTKAESKTVSAVINGVTLGSTIAVSFIPGVPAYGAISASTATPEASLTGTTVDLTITVTDASGNLVQDNTSVALLTNFGVIGGSGNTVGGIVTRTLTGTGKGTAHLTFSGITATGDTTIDFIDTTIPVITRIGDATVSVEYRGTYTDAGAAALDNIDGDITSSIVVGGLPIDTSVINVSSINPIDKIVATYTVTYDVDDSSSNHADQVIRTVNVIDTTKPVITSIVSDATSSGILKISNTITFTLIPTPAEPIATVDGSYNEHALTWSTADSGATYTATYTVTEGDADQTSPLQITGVTMTDEAGNVSDPASGSDVAKTIDANRPILTYVHIESNNAHNNLAKIGDTVTLTFTANESISEPTVTIATNSVTVTGGPTDWTAEYVMQSGDIEGTVPFTIDSFSDLAGNGDGTVTVTTDASSVMFDRTAPAVPTVSLTDPINSANQTSIAITGSGEADASINYAISDSVNPDVTGTGAVAGDGSINITGIDVSSLADGTLSLSVVLTDAAGNTSDPGTDTATKDTVAPSIIAVDANPNTGYAKIGDSVSVTLTASGAQSDLALNGDCKINDVNVASTFVNNVDGTYNIVYTVSSGDSDRAAGNLPILCELKETSGNSITVNAFTDSNTLAIDANEPPAPAVSLTDPINIANQADVAITGTGEANATIDYTITDSLLATVTGSSTVAGDGSINITGIDVSSLADGTLSLSVVLTDAAGNTSDPGTDTATKDTVAPVISSITSDASAPGVLKIDDTIKFTLTPSSPELGATVVGSYLGDTLIWTTSDGGSTYTATYTIDEGDLDQTIAQQISGVVITDEAGNPSIPGSGSDVLKTIDANKPTLPSVYISSSNTNPVLAKVGDTITVSFTANEDLGTPVVTIAGQPATVADGPASWTATYIMAVTDAEGVVPFTVDFTDLAGNAGVQVTATTDASSVMFDRTAPLAPAVSLTDPINIANQANVAITGTGEANAIINYTIKDSLLATVTGSSTVAGDGSINITGIDVSSLADGTLNLSVVLTDAAGNTSDPGVDTATKDTVAPVIDQHDPIVDVANSTGGRTNLIYTVTANDDLDGPITPTCVPPSSSTFLVSQTTDVVCNATDAAGNAAVPMTFTVTINPDTIAKMTVSASPSTLTATEMSTITVKGRDQFNNITTNQSGTEVVLSADNGGALDSPILTLANGTAATNLTKNSAGMVHVTVTSNGLSPVSTSVIFTPADTEGPNIITVNPSGSDASISAPLFFTTNEPMKLSSVNSTNIQLWKAEIPGVEDDPGTPEDETVPPVPEEQVPAVVSLVEGGMRANITPDTSLEYSTAYYFRITSGVTDEAGNALTNPKDNSNTGFTTAENTADLTAPTIVATDPENDDVDIPVNIAPNITFSEPLKSSTVSSETATLFDSDDNTVPAIVSLVEGGTRVIITPNSPFAYGAGYYFTISASITDEAGNAFAGPATYAFTTAIPTGIVVDEIKSQNPSAKADDSYLNGWRYTFRITINNPAETNLFVKFTDWVNTASELQTVAISGNTRLLFDRNSGGDLGAIVGLTDDDIINGFVSVESYALGNNYEDQALGGVPNTPVDLNGIDISTAPGRQVQFDVFTKLPLTTAPGFYETTFGIKAQ